MLKKGFINRVGKGICLLLAISILSSGSNCYASDNSVQTTQIQSQSFTNLKEKELKNYELSGPRKKDWAQRLQWFENKIINYYKGLNKQNILVVGEQKFLDVFKVATEKHNWQASFTYATSANSPKIERGGYNLVIDAQYDSKHFKKIYGTFKVSSFKDVYAEILYDETLTFLEKNGVKYYFFEGPILKKVKNLDETENKIISRSLTGKEKFELLFKIDNKAEQYITTSAFRQSKIINNGRHNVLKDVNVPYYNVINGKRITKGNLPNNHKKIFCFGPCTVQGWRSPDEYTIPSFIQSNININDFEYNVTNCGLEGGPDTINDFEYILSTNFESGDIVVNLNVLNHILKSQLKKYNINIYETSNLFDRPHNYGYWLLESSWGCTGLHMNHIGNRVIADYIYNVIKPDLNNDETTEPQKTVKYQFENEMDTFLDDNPDFKNYLDELKVIKEKNNVNGKVGSIVMNCNPFTLGHRYLIEQAAKQVDHLYIFVVEEDKSVFPFKDRMELVKKGVADLGNKVTVLPSGKWIISLLTFPEYFNKDDLQGAAIDPSNDIKLFGKYICPALGINKRFVGEEPFDLVTRQYNDTMRREFPLLNIDFEEIPRKAIDGEDVISATKVRKALKENDFETLKKYVPQTTFDYLKENQEEIVQAIDKKYNY